MPLIDELLDNIRETEFKQLHFLQRFGSRRGSITTTAKLRSLARITPSEPTLFKSNNIFNTILATPFMIVLLCTLIGVLIGRIALMPGILFASFLFLIVYLLLLRSLFNKRLNYTITLTRQGISFDDNFFSWTDIQETAILWLPIGKGGTYYLVLLFRDNKYEKWNLTNFHSFLYPFGEKLATHIEYFKALKTNN